jgi:hypothetical protein
MDALKLWMMDNFFIPGRTISYNKTAPKGHQCVWNANICTKSRGKIWFGDLDLTDDDIGLCNLARHAGEHIYILREHDARFDTENSPRFEENSPRFENAVAEYAP